MDEEQLKLLYAAMSKDFDIGDYNTFKSKMSTTDDRKKFYDAISTHADLGDYNQFEDRIGGKKKIQDSNVLPTPLDNGLQDGGSGLQPTPKDNVEEQTQIPIVSLEKEGNVPEAGDNISLALQADKLGKEINGIGGFGMEIPKEKSVQQSKEIKAYLKEQGIDADEIAKDFEDLPETVVKKYRYNEHNPQPLDYKALDEIRATNPIKYKTVINDIKNREILDAKKEAEYEYLDRPRNEDEIVENGNKQKDIIINHAIEGADKDKALARIDESINLRLQQAIPDAVAGGKVLSEKISVDGLTPTNPTLFGTEAKSNNINDYTLESIAEKINKNNPAQVRAFEVYKKGRDLEDAGKNAADFDEMAINFMASQNPQLKAQIDKLNEGGEQLPDAYKGQLVSQALNDKEVIAKAKQDPEFAKEYRQTAENLYSHYPEFAKQEVATIISQAREDKDLNNWWANIPKKEETDALVDKLVKEGKLTEGQKNVYDKLIAPELGVGKSIARGFGHILAPAFTDNSPISTPDIVSHTGEGWDETMGGLYQSIKLAGAAQNPTVQINTPKDLQEALKKESEAVAIQPKGVLHQASAASGDFIPLIVSMAAGGGLLKGLGTTGEALNMGLQFAGKNNERALVAFPDSPLKQKMYTGASTMVDMFLGRLLPHNKAASDAISKGLTKDITATIQDFADEKISAAVAKKTILDRLKTLVTEKVPDIVKSNIETGGIMSAFSAAHGGLDIVFGATPDKKISDVANETLQGFKTGFLGNTLVAAAMGGKNTRLVGENLVMAASNPEHYKDLIKTEATKNPEIFKQQDELIKNIDAATEAKKVADEQGMTPSQTEKFVLLHVAQSIEESKSKNATVDLVKESADSKAKDLKAQKEKIFKGEDIPIVPQQKEESTKLTQPIEGLDENGVPKKTQGSDNPFELKIEPYSESWETKKENQEPDITVGEMMDKTGTYKGEKGSFYQDGKTVIFKVDGKNKEYELGNIDELKDTPISDFDISHEKSVVTINDEGGIKVRDNDYVNNYSNPLAAINHDADGNVVSVNLETADGKKRTFRGNIAEDIAYQIHLKEINKNDETRAAFEQHINEDADAKKEIDNAGLSETTKTEPNKNNETVSRETVKPKVVEVKPIEVTKTNVNEEAKAEKPTTEAAIGVTENNEPITSKKEGIEPENVGENTPPPNEGEPIGIFVEGKRTILSHRGLQEVATEFGLNDVNARERVSDLTEFKNADNEITDWQNKGTYGKNIEKLISDAESGEALNFKQRVILQQHLANERQRVSDIRKNKGIDSKEYNDALKDLSRLKEAGQIARSTAGAALRVGEISSNPKPTMEDWMAEKMESTGVDELTPKQKEEVEKDFNDYEAKAKASDEKLAQANEEIAKLKAEIELAKNKKSVIRKHNQASLKVERGEIIDSIKEKLRKARGEQNVTVVPYAKELFSIAPDVSKLVRNLVETGVSKLEDVIDNIHESLKDVIPDLRKEDVRDIIAGEYNEKKPTKGAIETQIKDLRDEAKLIKKLEDLMNHVPTSEKIKVERNQRIKDLQDKIKEFRKLQSTSEKEAKIRTDDEILKSIKQRNESATKKLEERLKNKDFETQKQVPFNENAALKKANPKLYKEAMDSLVAKEEARHKFDLGKRQDELAKRSKIKKGIDFAGKLISTSKAIKAGIDDSVTFVQLGMAILANPKSGLKAKVEAIKAINNKVFKRQLAALHNSPYWNTIKSSGLDITEPKSLTRENVEELYSGNLIDTDFNLGGKKRNLWTNTGGIFERLFTSMGNNMRLNMFQKRIEYLENQGKTFDSHPQEYKDAARVINELTGRGKVNTKIQGAMPVISPIIWAPKMLSSSLNLLGISDLASVGMKDIGTKGLYRTLTPEQRKYAFGQMAKGLSMGISVMTALAMAGWSVDKDPESSTFGNVKHGTTSYNVFGRFAGLAKVIIQTVTGKKKSGFGTTDLDEKGGRGRVLGKFFRGKMTPFAGESYDYIFNSQKNTFTKQPINAQSLPNDLLTPISLADLKNGLNQDGAISLLTRWLPAVEGIQVIDDRDFKNDFKINNYKDGGRPINPQEYKTYLDKKEEETNKQIDLLKRGERPENAFVKDGVEIIKLPESNDPDKKMTEDEKKAATTAVKTEVTEALKKQLFGDKPEKTPQEKQDENLQRSLRRQFYINKGEPIPDYLKDPESTPQ